MSMRLRCGLRWRGTRPSLREMWPLIWPILAILAILAIYGAIDAYERCVERALMAEKAADIMEASYRTLRDCERGASGYYYPDGRAYECPKAL